MKIFAHERKHAFLSSREPEGAAHWLTTELKRELAKSVTNCAPSDFPSSETQEQFDGMWREIIGQNRDHRELIQLTERDL